MTEEETRRYWEMRALLDDAISLASFLTSFAPGTLKDRYRREIQSLQATANEFRL